MHHIRVAWKFRNLLNMQAWQAASAGLKAMLAYHQNRAPAALAHWERFVQLEGARTSQTMAFYVTLMTLNKRPAEERLAMLRRVAAGEFRRNNPEDLYAEAVAHYWVAYLTNRSDVFERWLAAYRIKPEKGWVLGVLPPLPDNVYP